MSCLTFKWTDATEQSRLVAGPTPTATTSGSSLKLRRQEDRVTSCLAFSGWHLLADTLLFGRQATAGARRSIGAVTWFPVHCTSINNTNRLISGDNKVRDNKIKVVCVIRLTNTKNDKAAIGGPLPVAAVTQGSEKLTEAGRPAHCATFALN